MASKFLKSNFKSMNKTEEDKLKELNDYRKSIVGVAAGEKEIEFLSKSVPDGLPKGLSDIVSLKKLWEEDK